MNVLFCAGRALPANISFKCVRCACGKQTLIKIGKNVCLRRCSIKWEVRTGFVRSEKRIGTVRGNEKEWARKTIVIPTWNEGDDILPWIIHRSSSTWYVARIIINCIWLFDCVECILCMAGSIHFIILPSTAVMPTQTNWTLDKLPCVCCHPHANWANVAQSDWQGMFSAERTHKNPRKIAWN